MKLTTTEIEYLKYFFDQVNISPEERIFIEEGFELCFNKKVPDNMKMKIDNYKKIPKAPKVPSIEPTLNDENYTLLNKKSGEFTSLSILINQLKEFSKS